MIITMFRHILYTVSRSPAHKLANGGRKALVPMLFAQNMSASQNMSTKTMITKNLQLTTGDENVSTDREQKLSTKWQSKPLAIVFSWLMAQNRHLDKYSNIYLQNGFDVLIVKITPWQLLWPMKGSQIIAQNVLDFINARSHYESIVLHSFSVGGYLYGELLHKMNKNPDKYGTLKTRIIGQIFDSPVDYEGIPAGLPNAVTRNPVLQKSLAAYVRYHLKTFQSQATQHYKTSSATFHDNPVNSPALFLFSKDDPVAMAESVQTVIDKWEAKGMKVYLRCWDSSPHVSHMHIHPKEYAKEIQIFLEKIDIVAPASRQQNVNVSKL